MNVQIVCKTHGEVVARVDANAHAYCPECLFSHLRDARKKPMVDRTPQKHSYSMSAKSAPK